MIYAEEMLLGPAIFFGKSSLLLLYYRIFSPSKAFRYKIYGGLIFAAISQLAIIPIDSIYCAPPAGTSWAIFNPNCYKSYGYGIAQGLSNLLLDLFIFYLPIPVIWHLQMPLKKRIGVIAIFMTGAMYCTMVSYFVSWSLLIICSAVIASIIVMVFRVEIFRGQDEGWNGYMTFLCG